jgi:pseudouridine kinase
MGIKKIFCVGGANIDHKFRALEAIESGTSNPVSEIRSFGGVARNVAENLAAWTSGVYLRSVVGDDSDGRHLLSHLEQSGVNIDGCLKLKNHSTSHYYAVLDSDGELHTAYAAMEIYNHVPVNLFVDQYCDWPQESIVFIDTNLPEEIIEFIIKQIPAKKIQVCIDPVSVAKAKRIPAVLKDVFLIKPNQSEAGALTGLKTETVSDCIQAGRVLLDRGAINVVISMGSQGYVIVNQDQETHFPAYSADRIVDVNGSGDAFLAGILFGLQQKYTIIHACEIGTAAAVLTLQSDKTVASDIGISRLHAYMRTCKRPNMSEIQL